MTSLPPFTDGCADNVEPLLQRIARHALQSPASTAVVAGERSLSYAELHERSDRLAVRLRGHGIGAESVLGLWSDRSVDAVVGVLGIWKAGAAYLPLDPALPAIRLQQMVKDARLEQIVIGENVDRSAIPDGPALMRVQDASIADAAAPEPLEFPAARAAYLIYTSGSTGTPKAVVVTHAGLAAMAAAHVDHLQMDAQSRMLQFASLGFDVSVGEMLSALWAGAAIVLVPVEAQGGQRLQSLLEEQRVTHAMLTPTVLATLHRSDRLALQCLVVGGESCPAGLVTEWCRGIRMINAYGPTEATVCATMSAPLGGMPLDVGTALSGTTLQVLDEALQPVQAGAVGELYISGPGLARGYHDRPSLTASRFVANPHGEPGSRMYRSGDLMRLRGDGALEYVGRADQQVKLRGHRIELGEIEAALAAQPSIAQAVVLVHESPAGRSLQAYMTGRSNMRPGGAQLRAALAAHLPQYMIPAGFTWLGEMPRMPSGKVNRDALPALTAAIPARDSAAPAGEVETVIADHWKALLQRTEIGRHDNFFELGGDSLMLTQLADGLARRGWRVGPRTLFARPTIAELAAAIDMVAPVPFAASGGAIASGCTRITPAMLPLLQLDPQHIDAIVAQVPGGGGNVQDILPLVPLQEGLLIQHRALARDPYVMRAQLEFADRDRLDAFLNALQQVIARHESLRTAVLWRGLPRPVQVVWRETSVPEECLAADSRGSLDALWDAGAQSIDVTRAPMLRVQTMPDAAGARWHVMVHFHHLTMDHVSLELVLQEICACMDGRAATLQAAVSFRHFVVRALEQSNAPGHGDYFRRMLAGFTETSTPFGIRDARTDGSDVREHRLELQGELPLRLRRQARRFGVSASTIFHLAWARVLARASDRQDIVFGTVLSGRLDAARETSGTVGLCINTLPLRLQTGLDAAVALRETHARLGELLRHELAPLSAALAASALPRGAPLFTAVLNYHHDPMGLAASQGVQLAAGMKFLRATERTNYRLGLSVDERGEIFGLTSHADASVGADAVCQLMVEQIAQLTAELEQSTVPDFVPEQLPAAPLVSAPDSAEAWIDQGRGQHVAPRGAVEEALAAIWSEVLRVRRIGRTDDFFSLGGHSLLALQVVARIRDVFGVELPLKSLFDAATLADLGRGVEQLREGNAPKGPDDVVPVHWEGPAPLSYSQERMWLIQSMNPSNVAYNMSAATWIRGPLDAEAFMNCFDELIRRHDILRSRVQLVDGDPRQTMHAWHSGNLPLTDLRGTARADAVAVDTVTAGARVVFDLERDPVFRAWLIRTADQHFLFGMVVHHIASDMWSMGVFMRELATLYGLRNRPAESLPVLPISYRDYAAWQRSPNFSARFEQQLQFWRHRLANLPAVELPTDHPRPRLWTMNGAMILRKLPAELVPALARIARSTSSTSFMALFAGFVVLLARITGQRDIPVGVPVANRTHRSIEGLMGTFVNTIVLRADLAGDPTYEELLARIRDTTFEAFANQDIPFDRLVQELGQRGARNQAPLAQVMFNVVNAPMHGIDFDGISWKDELLERGGSQFELSITVDTEYSNSLVLEYNTDLFTEDSAQRFVDQYVTLLEAAVAAPRSRLFQLPVVPVSQLVALRDFNATGRQWPDQATFPALFAAQATLQPERVAVSYEGESLTYAELNSRADALAARLHADGAGAGTIVAVCMSRSLQLLVALLAVQKSGAAYLPLDPDFPAERLNYMLSDSHAMRVLVAGGLPDNIVLPAGVEALEVDDDHGMSTPVTTAKGPRPGDAAYVLYTSGSTGRPKGVVVAHGALANFLLSMREQPGLAASDILAAVTTVSFDIAGLELYLPLVVGARIELVSRDTATEGQALIELLQRSGATMLQATPATWRMLLEAGWTRMPGLRALCGGEALSRRLADDILDRVDELWNMYGPTETTVWSTLERVQGEGVISIGRPIANTQVHVCDAAGNLCPIGVAGEICIGGDGVALGYHARPALTAERFVADSHTRVPGRRLYRTGDLGRWTADGRLHHLGRLDHQVKVRGFRIELGEIEQVLTAHPAVHHAVAAVREARPDDQRLVAYVVFREDEEATATELKRFLRERLPEYAVPSIVIPVASMPLTPNGKVDRAALPDPFEASFTQPAISEPLGDGTERLLADAWKEILRIAEVGPNDNFFDLGGHSLLSLRVVRLLEKHFDHPLDPRVLFFGNLREIARQVDADEANRGSGAL